MTAVSIRDLTVTYSEKPVLWDIDLDWSMGALTAVVGPNGAGKSTLVKAALGLIPVAAGTALFLGQPLDQARGKVAYVPQRSAVDWDFPTDVLDVTLMGTYGALGWFRRPGGGERSRAMAALEQVGMADLAHRQINELSGGQQQRTFLARALVQGAEVTILDEPFTGVDAVTEQKMIEVFRSLRDAGKAVIAVHHDLDSVPMIFDEVTLLNTRLIAHGPVDEVFSEPHLRATYGGTLAQIARRESDL
jgi:manganese/zinc/iron transport system ATP- binding protein